jgi:poly(A) polymerase
VESAERIAQELKKMLVDPHRRRAMELARDMHLLLEILPELKPVLDAPDGAAWDATLRRLRLLQDPSFELAAAALLASVPEVSNRGHGGRERESVLRAICRRLRLSNQETEAIDWLLTQLPDVLISTTKSLAQLKRILAHTEARNLLELARADRLAADGDLSGAMHCEELLRRTPPEQLDPPPLVTGEDLIELGLKPGKKFGKILDAVREAQLNEELNSREDAMRLVEQLIKKGHRPEP